MARDIIPSLHVVGLSVVVGTLKTQTSVSRDELLLILRRCGLRGGAIPWTDVLTRARALKLFSVVNDMIHLSGAGRTLATLTAESLEPTDDFERALALCSLGQSSERLVFSGMRVQGRVVQGGRLGADAVLGQLQALGVVQPGTATGEWIITSDLWEPVLAGLFMSARSSEAAHRIGRIGEALTLRYLEEQGCSALHLSPIADVFGFDILSYGCLGFESLAVEAKATVASTTPTFFLSRNELRLAQSVGPRYWVVVWAGVNDALSDEENYRALRARGQPRIVKDPHAVLTAGCPPMLGGYAIPDGSVRADGLIWTLP
ncbi:MAG: DUF3883 domain-containing protein [Planctomycetes bacterium]|nr:DUF3883 domain-containing protein [Planctomycetota bacterium]